MSNAEKKERTSDVEASKKDAEKDKSDEVII
mgnify:CR=1 FL=1